MPVLPEGDALALPDPHARAQDGVVEEAVALALTVTSPLAPSPHHFLLWSDFCLTEIDRPTPCQRHAQSTPLITAHRIQYPKQNKTLRLSRCRRHPRQTNKLVRRRHSRKLNLCARSPALPPLTQFTLSTDRPPARCPSLRSRCTDPTTCSMHASLYIPLTPVV